MKKMNGGYKNMSKPKSTSKEIVIARMFWSSYSKNPELIELEKAGLLRGLSRGKTTNVPLRTLFESLEKQYKDWLVAYDGTIISEMKKTLADLRNVAGIIFLKLKEGDKKE